MQYNSLFLRRNIQYIDPCYRLWSDEVHPNAWLHVTPMLTKKRRKVFAGKSMCEQFSWYIYFFISLHCTKLWRWEINRCSARSTFRNRELCKFEKKTSRNHFEFKVNFSFYFNLFDLLRWSWNWSRWIDSMMHKIEKTANTRFNFSHHIDRSQLLYVFRFHQQCFELN